MQADSYYVNLKENGNGDLIVKKGTQEIHVCELENISGLSAAQLETRAKEELHLHDIEISNAGDTAQYMDDQKVDLSLVRTKMRQILKELSDTSTPIEKRKDVLSVYQQECSAAQIIINTCKLELQIDQVNASRNKKAR